MLQKIKTMGTKVQILGQRYHITGEDETYLQEIARYVDKEIKHSQKLSHSYSSSRLYVLACLNLADKLKKLDIKHKNLISRGLETIDRLISTIDRIIKTTDSF